MLPPGNRDCLRCGDLLTRNASVIVHLRHLAYALHRSQRHGSSDWHTCSEPLCVETWELIEGRTSKHRRVA